MSRGYIFVYSGEGVFHFFFLSPSLSHLCKELSLPSSLCNLTVLIPHLLHAERCEDYCVNFRIRYDTKKIFVIKQLLRYLLFNLDQ